MGIRRLSFGAICTLAMAAAAAQTSDLSVESLSRDKCQIREVIARLQLKSGEREAQIATQALPILDDIRDVSAKASRPNVPLRDQLNSDELSKFSALTQRLLSTQLASLVESRRQRDLKVLERMVMLADREYRWDDRPNENSADFTIYSLLLAWRAVTEKIRVTGPIGETCNLTWAFYSLVEEPMRKVNAEDSKVTAATAYMESLLHKYGGKKLDPSKVTAAERARLAELSRDVIEPNQRRAQFITDIERIKLLGEASELMYVSNTQDILNSGGDPDALGRTLREKGKKGGLNERMQMAIALWTKINEVIPSDHAVAIDRMGKSLDK